MAYATTNPYTGEVVKEFPTATPDEVSAAIERADATFAQWRTTSLQHRADLLAKAAELLRADHRHYAELLTLEMGKVITEAEAEVELTAKIFEYYARYGAHLLAPSYIPAEGYGDTDVALVNDPLGIIFTVEPWNFPYYQIVRTTAPLVMGGNTVLLKHASNVPQSAAAFEDLMRKAGAPEGLFTNLYAPHEAAEQILGDPRVRGVALTGSEGAGATIASIAAKHLKKSTLELGGADAFVVLDDADVAKAARWAVFGRHWNAGQVCTSSKRLIVADSVYDEFLAEYRKGVAELVAGDPMDSSTTLAPLMSQQAADQLADQVATAKKEGATVETLGSPVPEQGAFFQPTLLTDIPEGSVTASSEFFGPVAQLYRVADEDEAVRVANSSPFGLGGSVFSTDIPRAQRVARRLDTGMVYINHPTGAKADIPFGGVKHSGYGHELLDLGLKEFVNQKVVAVADIDAAF